jgi:GH15 family glucan-1,4-alpha-glucosidase
VRIADYAFLSDCQSAALVGNDGSVDWYCTPRLDAPSVFARLLDHNAGHWHIRPRGEYRVRRAYLDDSLVLRTVFETPRGAVAVTDALGFEPGARGHEIGLRVPHEMLRRIEGLEGSVDIEMEFVPRMEYGLTKPRLEWDEGRVRATGGPVELTLESEAPMDCSETRVNAAYLVRKGDAFTYRLRYRDSFADTPHTSAEGASIEDTVEGWRSWVGLHRGYEGRYLAEVRKSALVLQGLTFAPAGPVAAAPTTSLPEVLGGSANWDYRYAWIRDASLTLFALWVAACPHEPFRFFHWIERAGGKLEDEPVQIVYGVTGQRDLTEHTLGNLEGYQGSKPVRVGNDAWTQRQLDVLGWVLDAAHVLKDQLGDLDPETKELLVGYADRAVRDWRRSDAGMWEVRDRERHYTSSKVMCWVALDRAVKLADRIGAGRGDVERWERARDDVKGAVLAEAWSDRANAYAGAFGSDDLDASVLLLPIVGFLPATDPRMRATIDAVERRLATGGLVRRWEGEPNAFLICSYWLSECLVMAGELDRGKRVFERVTSLANDLGLLSEEADAGTGELLGNFPQAFSHIGLVNAAWRLTEAIGGRMVVLSAENDTESGVRRPES